MLRNKGLNREHHRDTFSVSNNNNKCKYTRIGIYWYQSAQNILSFAKNMVQ